jgi:beta-lactamase class A
MASIQARVFDRTDLAVAFAEDTPIQSLEAAIRREFESTAGEFALAFRNLGKPAESLFISANESFHAASTMKVPVMIEVYKQAVSGRISLRDLVLIKNEFRSIVDGTSYTLRVSDDNDDRLYKHIGSKKSIRELVDDMIIHSSNLATNLLIEVTDARRVTQTMRQLGARDTQVLRGVEDTRAFERGLNNTTTAFDLMLIYERLAQGEVISHRACDEMILTLLDQSDCCIIPARLPTTVKVANKTGKISGVHHDSAVVYLPNGKKYVLVLLSKNVKNIDEGTQTLARVSELVYQFMAGI